jgi:hypothetical protein
MDRETRDKKSSDRRTCEKSEKSIEAIVISLFQGFALVADNHKLVNELEKGLMESVGIDDALGVVAASFKKFMNIIEKKFFEEEKRVYKGLESTKSNLEIEGSDSEGYFNLEKLVQKYESDIRDHIRIEQESHLFSEEIIEQTNALAVQNKELKRQVGKLEMKLEYVIMKQSINANQNTRPNHKILKAEQRGISNSFISSKRAENLSAEIVRLEELRFSYQYLRTSLK